MLKKTMNKVINKKIGEWLDTITDSNVRHAIKEDLILTGGCIASMIDNDAPNDYDCYFRTKETVLKVANYYADIWNKENEGQSNKLKKGCKVFVLDGANPSQEIIAYYGSKGKTVGKDEIGSVIVDNCPPERVKMVFPSDGITGDINSVRADEELGLPKNSIEVITELDEAAAKEVEEKEKREYFPVFISSNAITLSNGVQIIVRFYGEADEVQDTFDFAHTLGYWDIKDDEVVIPNRVYEAVTNKTLFYTGSKYPVCSIFRLRKFISRGWKINAGQMLKICMQISELDLKDINVLEDQLIGVDSVYFMQLINQFKRQEGKGDFKLTSGYLLSIIDKIF